MKPNFNKVNSTHQTTRSAYMEHLVNVFNLSLTQKKKKKLNIVTNKVGQRNKNKISSF